MARWKALFQDSSNDTLLGLIALVLQKRFDFGIWGLFGCLHQDLSWVMSKQALKGGRLEPDHNGQALTAQCLGSTSSNVHANKSTGGLARRLSQDEILQNIAEEHTGFDVTNAFHVFKSNKPCSQRTQVAALVAKASSMPRSSAQRYCRNKKRQKQEDALKEITEAPDSLKISSSVLQKFCLVFTNDPTDGPLELSKCTPNVPHPVSLSSWKVIGESGDQGSIFPPDNQKLPAFLKPPRQILTSDNVTQYLLDVLEKLETTCNHQSRGKSRYVGCDEHKTNYITLGVHANRGRKGLVDSKFSKLKAKEKWVILQFIKQLETQLEKWIDWSYSFAFENAARNGEFKLWSHKGKSTHFFSSVAFGRNVFLQAHTDNDFGLSISVVMLVEPSNKDKDEVLAQFVFSEHGQVVALRHLDIIIFNPLEYHCVSKRATKHDIFCLTCYLKTAVVGKNDNTISITDNEKAILAAAKNKTSH